MDRILIIFLLGLLNGFLFLLLVLVEVRKIRVEVFNILVIIFRGHTNEYYNLKIKVLNTKN